MNDRELLELAAKAAGYLVWVKEVTVRIWHPNTEWTTWNPLTYDGDALRLAVNLRIGIEINERSIVASWVDGGYEPNDVCEYPESIQNEDFDIVHVNHDKATRRAIVRAAAEIGRQMREGEEA